MLSDTDRPTPRSELPVYSQFKFKGIRNDVIISDIFDLEGTIEDAYIHCVREWGISSFLEVEPVGI